MADHVSKERRSEIMALVKSKDTKPEQTVRKLLYSDGFRYRLHVKELPGKPDMVFRKYKAVIFVNGCFWHGHDCGLFKGLPKTKTEFWRAKISTNHGRDLRNIEQLRNLGWRVCVIWECALKRKQKLSTEQIVSTLADWLKGGEEKLDVRGYL